MNTSLGKPRSNEYSWLRDLLGGLRTSWAANIQLESPDQYINHEFLGIDVQTKKTDLYIPDEPAYGMVSIERAPRVNPNIKKATIVCPTQNQLEAYAIDQKGGTPGDTYTNLRLKQRPVADDENRKITRWTTMADTIGLNVKRDTSVTNCISICFAFENNGLKSLFTGDHVGQSIRDGLGATESSRLFSKWNLLKVATMSKSTYHPQ